MQEKPSLAFSGRSTERATPKPPEVPRQIPRFPPSPSQDSTKIPGFININMGYSVMLC